MELTWQKHFIGRLSSLRSLCGLIYAWRMSSLLMTSPGRLWFTHVVSEAASCTGASDPSQLNLIKLERLEIQVWVDVAGRRNRGQIYNRQSLACTYRWGSELDTSAGCISSGSKDIEEVR